MNLCPVCRYPDPAMTAPPEPYYICPCCGTEFALDDEQKTHAQLRDEWIARGMPWFSTYTPPPTRWSPADQLGLTAKR